MITKTLQFKQLSPIKKVILKIGIKHPVARIVGKPSTIHVKKYELLKSTIASTEFIHKVNILRQFAHMKHEGLFNMCNTPNENGIDITLSPIVIGKEHCVPEERYSLLTKKMKLRTPFLDILSMHNHPKDVFFEGQFFSCADYNTPLTSSALGFVPVKRHDGFSELTKNNMTVIFSTLTLNGTLEFMSCNMNEKKYRNHIKNAVSTYIKGLDKGLPYYEAISRSYDMLGKKLNRRYFAVNYDFGTKDKVKITYDPLRLKKFTYLFEWNYQEYIHMMKLKPPKGAGGILSF